MTESLTDTHQMVGIAGLWSGSEGFISVMNPVIEFDGVPRITRGENWTVPSDLATASPFEQDGFEQPDFWLQTHAAIDEGVVVWVAGPKVAIAVNYLVDNSSADTFIEAASRWPELTNGWHATTGYAREFYKFSAELAREARLIYEEVIATSTEKITENPIAVAARAVYSSSPGVPIEHRLLADAVWNQAANDWEMLDRTVSQLARRRMKEVAEVQRDVEAYITRLRDNSNAVRTEMQSLRGQVQKLSREKAELLQIVRQLGELGAFKDLGTAVALLTRRNDSAADSALAHAMLSSPRTITEAILDAHHRNPRNESARRLVDLTRARLPLK